ncbi:MAG: hypothetical protein M1816_002811 [Peltula sp. TS41687]|nr:MAG: hypothetical protein M1816_002811 [Peltula sp. TS41687]
MRGLSSAHGQAYAAVARIRAAPGSTAGLVRPPPAGLRRKLGPTSRPTRAGKQQQQQQQLIRVTVRTELEKQTPLLAVDLVLFDKEVHLAL